MIDEAAVTDDLDDEIDDTDDDGETLGSNEESTDNVGDPSVEINVQDLITELEADGLTKKLDGGLGARKRLEELMEKRRARRDLEDFDDYEI